MKTVALVAQQGSFAGAARVLNMDPSSVSRAVSNVEEALGFRVFQRTTRVVSITEAGATYLDSLMPLLEGLDQAQEAAAQSILKPSGTLRMTASVAFAHECVVPTLATFREKYPDVAIDLMPSDAMVDIAAEGVDLAMRLVAEPSGNLIATKLMTTRYQVCASPDYLARKGPISGPSDLEQHSCLRFALPDYRTRWRFRDRAGDTQEVAVDGALIISNALALRRATVDGLGPALLADWLVADDLKAGRLVNVFPDFDCTATRFQTGAWALYPSRRYLPRKVRVMIDHLRENLPRNRGG